MLKKCISMKKALSGIVAEVVSFLFDINGIFPQTHYFF